MAALLNIPRYGMVWYGMVWYGMVWYGMVMVWYGSVWYGMVLENLVGISLTSVLDLLIRSWLSLNALDQGIRLLSVPPILDHCSMLLSVS